MYIPNNKALQCMTQKLSEEKKETITQLTVNIPLPAMGQADKTASV